MAVSQSIFIAFSNKDQAFSLRLVDDIKQKYSDSSSVFHSSAGEETGDDAAWETEKQQMQTSGIFIVVLSPDAVASPWLNAEIDFVWRQRNTGGNTIILPVLYRECVPRDDLEMLQFISFLPPKGYQTGLTDLFVAIDKINAHTYQESTSPDELAVHEDNTLVPSPTQASTPNKVPVALSLNRTQARGLFMASIIFLIVLIGIFALQQTAAYAQRNNVASTATAFARRARAIQTENAKAGQNVNALNATVSVVAQQNTAITLAKTSANETATAQTSFTLNNSPYHVLVPGPCDHNQVWGDYDSNSYTCGADNIQLVIPANSSNGIGFNGFGYNNLPAKQEASIEIFDHQSVAYMSVDNSLFNFNTDSTGNWGVYLDGQQNANSYVTPLASGVTTITSDMVIGESFDGNKGAIFINNHQLTTFSVHTPFTLIASIGFQVISSQTKQASARFRNFLYTPIK